MADFINTACITHANNLAYMEVWARVGSPMIGPVDFPEIELPAMGLAGAWLPHSRAQFIRKPSRKTQMFRSSTRTFTRSNSATIAQSFRSSKPSIRATQPRGRTRSRTASSSRRAFLCGDVLPRNPPF